MAELVDAHDSNSCTFMVCGFDSHLRYKTYCRLNIHQSYLKMKNKSQANPYGSKQAQFDQRYLEMAHVWAKNSYCNRRKVGALIVKDKMIISDGYNGTPSGFENYCEDEEGLTKVYVLHAEANAITKVAKSNNSSDGATLYITTSPCMECAKLIIQAGIIRVVFSDPYHIDDGVKLLQRAGIEIIKMNISMNSINNNEKT